MQERSYRSDSRSRRNPPSSRASSTQRSARRASEGARQRSQGAGRRRDMGAIGDDRRPPTRSTSERLRSVSDRGQSMQRRQRTGRGQGSKGGYQLRNRNINFSGRSSYDPQLIIVGGIAIAIIILLIFFIVSCATSCGSGTENPAENVSSSLEGDLRTQVESMVTSDYQSTYVAENAELYPTELIQLMVDEPASVSFVYNYPNASHEAQPYEEQVSKGSVPLLYDWDARWGYVDYAGSMIGLKGSGPTAVAMARMALLGATDVTPATVAANVTQLGGATGDSGMAATLFGTDSGDTTTPVDADGDGYDDNTGEAIEATGESSDTSGGGTSDASASSSQGLAQMIGLTASPITVEPGNSITATMVDAVENGSYVLVETSGGAFGATPHWALVIGVNSDGSVAVYDPTSVANSLHAWDPGTVVDGSTALIALSVPGGSGDANASSDHVDEDGDGYDDSTGEYIGDGSDEGSGGSDDDTMTVQ